MAFVSAAAWVVCTDMLITAATLLPEQDAKEAAAGSTTPAAGFGFGFASGSNNPFAALTSSSKTGGFGGFGGFGSAQPSKAGDTPAGELYGSRFATTRGLSCTCIEQLAGIAKVMAKARQMGFAD